MANLKRQIQEDLKAALKKKEEIKVSAIRMLNAAISNKEIEKRSKLSRQKPELKSEELAEQSILTDEETIETIVSESKKRKEAIAGFEKGGRADLVEKEKRELEILKKYLPEQLPEEEIRKIVKDIIQKTEAASIKDMGKVMAGLMPKVKGRADGFLVSKIVKESLS